MEYGRRWKNNVKAAQGHHDLQATKRSDWHEWHRQVLYLYRDENLWRDSRRTEHTEMNACMRVPKDFQIRPGLVGSCLPSTWQTCTCSSFRGRHNLPTV